MIPRYRIFPSHAFLGSQNSKLIRVFEDSSPQSALQGETCLSTEFRAHIVFCNIYFALMSFRQLKSSLSISYEKRESTLGIKMARA
jgi:hypothetical protein